MTEGLKFAAIDIGSNAMRLLFCRVLNNDKTTTYIKESLIRMPLRLGEDAFSLGEISPKNEKRLIKTIKAFSLMIEAYNPISYKSCATAALRSAKNGNKIVKKINKKTNANLKIITGDEEARLIMSNHIEKHLDIKKHYIYIDVGGGSTEISFIYNRKKAKSKSFPIGSVRLLKNQVLDKDWKKMQSWVESKRKKITGSIKAIGSGGNINKIFSIAEDKKKNEISFDIIKKVLDDIEPYNLKDRITVLGFRPDRADVISHAGKIYTSIMDWAGTKKMIVPQSGLPDGIIHELYDKYKDKN